MTNTGHTPGKDDHGFRGPLTAQEVNLLQYKLQVAESRIVELEAKLLLLKPTHPKTAPVLTSDEVNEISESLTRQTPMLIEDLIEHPSSGMVTITELVCNRTVELCVEYSPTDQSETP